MYEKTLQISPQYKDAQQALIIQRMVRDLDVPVRLVFAPAACDPAPLIAAGLRRVAGCTLYAFQGHGLQEYHRYMAMRYGFLHGRLRARLPEAA